jgi:hypothetical protein
MRSGYGKDRKVLADTFRATREMLGLPQPAYARLFEVERTLVQELEEGQLPAALDQRLLKFMLLTITLQRNPEFLAALSREMQNFYGLDHIFKNQFPLLTLYEQVLGVDMARWPWIGESIKFRCRAFERRRLGSFLLLWSQQAEAHKAIVNFIPMQTPAFINFINGRTLILLPALYLFLNLDTSHSTNPIVKRLETKLEQRELIGLALPRQQPTQNVVDDIVLEKMRLFAYSPDMGLLREAEQRGK